MRLCIFILKISNGGAERAAISIANHAVKMGHEVDLLCSIKDDDVYQMDERVNFIQLGDVNKKNIFTRVLSNVKRKFELDKYFKERKPDVLFYMVYPFILNVVKFPKDMVVIGSDRGNPAEYTDKKYVKRRAKLLSRTDGMVFQTERAKDFFADLKLQKTVIPNAIYNKNVFEAKTPEVKENSICAVGRLVYEKDYKTLIHAFSLVNKKHPDLTLKIFGAGELLDDIKSEAKKLGILDRVKMMGVFKNVAQEVVKSKCFVLSSISEGMPNALIEALALGMPCVSTDCPNGPAELIKNEENGLLVPVKDPKKLADAICKMIEDPDFASQCGKNAIKIRERVKEDEINNRYLEFLTSINKRG